MNCGYKEKTILYFYGELPEGAAAEMKTHLGLCALCAGDLSVLKSLSEGFDAFRPEAPALNTEELALAARGSASLNNSFAGPRPFEAPRESPGARLLAGFKLAAAAGACTALFLFAFRTTRSGNEPAAPLLSPAGGGGVTAAWKTDIDASLDSVEYGIYSLQDDMAYSSAADFDYDCADIENQKEQAA